MIAQEISEMIAQKSGAEGADQFDALDSLEFVELLQEVEERFGVKIPALDMNKVQTVADLARYVETHRC